MAILFRFFMLKAMKSQIKTMSYIDFKFFVLKNK